MTVPSPRRLLITLTLAVMLIAVAVPAVSANEVIWDYLIEESTDNSGTYQSLSGTASYTGKLNQIYINDISLHQRLNYVVISTNSNDFGYYNDNTKLESGRHEFTYYLPEQDLKTAVLYVERFPEDTRITIFFQDWDIESRTGPTVVTFDEFYFRNSEIAKYSLSEQSMMICQKRGETAYYLPIKKPIVTLNWASGIDWKNHVLIEKLPPNPLGGYELSVHRNVDGVASQSSVTLYNDTNMIFSDSTTSDILDLWFSLGSLTDLHVTSPTGRVYKFPVAVGGIDPTEEPVLRKGTVTMTDNNGTTITGFEVTAENAYTDQSYTVSTDTDVAVLNLPMERTIQIRNPQTGVYETALIGYYRFYGQAPGYKMLNEDGIQVSVMPEKYGSYQLCDIRVTPESGYLTGTHKFQIRSRSDNSILQSGTISAKSATTGEWYNATVSGGIGSLILPYDTSNSQSQYAGNYYVYATSPGYEDSDYGTQIVVMPHTVSEIQTVHLTPIGGIPTPGNVTLRIQVFSETGSGIPNAEIFISGVQGAGASVWDTYNASSTGYLTVSVPANSTYDIVASGTGYYDSARRVEVFDTDPSLIEIKLYLSCAPTVEPTTQPTGWITPTPTQTSPPIQEDSIIGLSVRGLAKGFGIDYDTALLMFGLMIIFGAGGMVMSSVKGGAMEFIAGSIVGTFVAFALGLIPIWIFIIIAVVFGAYVLRVFVQGGQ